ncbi:MAG: glycosyltransferase [Deltaproteobacteria bacterium]|nr:glycosyltransferase [Deltaproteobacteria bacterium]
MTLLALEVALLALALPGFAAATYLLGLTLLSRRSKAPASDAGSSLRFDFVVPAHDEERGIAETVRSLAAVEWPTAQRRVLVVADNCSDSTAAQASRAGATVLVRHCPERRGKGHALASGFARSLADGFADAVVVVDADTLVDRNLLKAFAARISEGARAVQADYAVRNPDAGWRTRLMSVAFSIFHGVRSLGRERLKLSCGLRGNGMCFTRQLLTEIPYDAFSIVEDVEYGLRLGAAGHRVWYAGDARVHGEMVASAAASASQRRRWEDGRAELRRRAPGLLLSALPKADGIVADLAIDLLVPPLARLGTYSVLGAAAAGALSLWAGHLVAALPFFGASLAFLGVYILRGWQLSGTGRVGLEALAYAPVYLAWKMALRVRGARQGQEWIRTARQGEAR